MKNGFNLHQLCLNKKRLISLPFKKDAGFTLLEVLIVIAVIVFLGVLTLPIGFDFYKTQQLDVATETTVQALRSARSKTISGELASNYGVYLQTGQCTIFKGDKWSSREPAYDVNYSIDQSITISGLNEINFQRLDGDVLETGTIILKNDQDTRAIAINKAGLTSLLAPTEQTVYLWPDSSGFTCQLTAQSSSCSGCQTDCLPCNNHYLCVDEDTMDEEYVAISGADFNQGKHDLYNLEPYTGSDNINYITVHYRVNAGWGGYMYYGTAQPIIRIDGATDISAPEVDLNAEFGTGQYMPPVDMEQQWLTKPDGSSWTAQDINNLQVGVILNTYGSHSGFWASLLQIYIEVNYLDYE